jgi:hypothetical protein
VAGDAMRTLFPPGEVELFEKFCEAAQALPLVELDTKSGDQPATEVAREAYAASRVRLIRAVRTMIAASLTERLRLRVRRLQHDQSGPRSNTAVRGRRSEPINSRHFALPGSLGSLGP